MSRNLTKRPTQLDVAKRAGIHRTTVSLALRGSPRIPQATQQKALKAARELGYSPDPMLSALAVYRNGRRKKSYHGTLVWLVNEMAGRDWRAVTMYEETFLGGKERAPVHGYTLEVFKLNLGKLTPQRAAAILQSRNVTGLLVCPQPHSNTQLEFPWEAFSAVTFGYSLVSPQLHTVVTAHFRAMSQAMQHIRALGYRRIGLVYSKTVDVRVAHNYLAGYLADCHLHQESGEPIIPLDPSEEDFGAWYRRFRPEAIVSAGIGDILQTIKKAKLSVGRDLGLACLPLPDRVSGLAGMYENSRHMGAFAVDMLVGMTQQGIRGQPELPHYTHVDSEWINGASLPARH